jgi:hypothetical protein
MEFQEKCFLDLLTFRSTYKENQTKKSFAIPRRLLQIISNIYSDKGGLSNLRNFFTLAPNFKKWYQIAHFFFGDWSKLKSFLRLSLLIALE